jgi:hypothetical protein
MLGNIMLNEKDFKHDLNVIINGEGTVEQVVSYLKTAGLYTDNPHEAIEAIEGEPCISVWYTLEEIKMQFEHVCNLDKLSLVEKATFMRSLDRADTFPPEEDDIIGVLQDLDYHIALINKD